MSRRRVGPGEAAHWGYLSVAVVALAVLALVSLALEFGFDKPPLPLPLLIATQIVAVIAYVLRRVFEVLGAVDRWRAVRSAWVDVVILLGAAVFLIVRLELVARPVLRVSALYVGVLQVMLLVRVGIAAVRLNLMLSQSRLRPTRVFALTFGAMILLGTCALSVPKATQTELHERPDFSIPRHLVNCAFTATSATCVTGLAVYDTGAEFTLYGQIVILILIQGGGLGIMIFGSVLGLLVGRRLSLRQSLAMQDAVSYRTVGDIRRIVLFVLVFTFLAEAIGAVAMLGMWDASWPLGRRLYYSVFHAVSAFCNAGFSLQPDSLVGFRRSWQVYGWIMPLIVLGGLGFPVLRDLLALLRAGARRWWVRWRDISRSGNLPRRHRLTLHTKVVLVTTLVLIVLPVFGFLAFETAHSTAMMSTDALSSMPFAGRLLDALFLSVTCRTAGFNTVAMDADSLSPGSHMLAAILMFVGGSPGSTAGGVKTAALFVLLSSVVALLRGRDRVEAFGRTVPERVVRRAAVVAVVMFALVGVITLLLCLTESVSLRAAMFEAVSACGTVGLSMGLTPELTMPGRIVIMLAMFAGRLGPLTLLVALAGEGPQARYDYPAEEVGIG